MKPTRTAATGKVLAVVPIDEAGNSEKWICKVRGNTHNILSSLSVTFLLWYLLYLLQRWFVLRFLSFLPSAF